ncbi:MAG: NADH-ubiquinone oxidoreductase-F iron-sulfur binding region domain-containing protein [Chloroflexota bacterium]
MTTLLQTPTAWPRVLLERATDGTTGSTRRASATETTLPDGAFGALVDAIRDLGQGGTLEQVTASGLRGRGGAGFPTGEKWRACAAQPSGRRFVVANGYGADPAVFTDGALMAADPWAVVEGVAIAAFAVGASEAVIAVRADAGAAIAGLESAILAGEGAGFLGPDILGTGWQLSIVVRAVQGAYMLGEETVLLKALEGKRGQPEQRPPYPTERGLFGQPTVVNNVQTLAAVPWIVRHGARAYAAIGSSASPGTMLVQVRGPLGDGIAEVPIGTPIREIVALATSGDGDGHPRPKRDGTRGAASSRSTGSSRTTASSSRQGATPASATKAVLVGGPAGGLLPPELLDTPFEFEALRAVGAHVGSGSIVVADQRACTVDLARLLTTYCSDEACGKSIPCRIGLRRLAEIGDRITTGRPKPTDSQLLVDLAHDVAESGLCEHERLATLPLLSGMRYFGPELDEHILRSSCPAGVCRPIAVAGKPAPQPSVPSA